MIVDKYGRVAGSIDLATLAQMYAQADDDDLRAHYREVAAESGVDLAADAEQPEPESGQPDEGDEGEPQPEAESTDLDALRAEAESLGVKVDGRWGEERLRNEIEGAREG